MLSFIALAFAAMAALGPYAALTSGWPLAAPHAIAFEPRSRQVTNWRAEAVTNLDLDWRLAATLAAGRDAPRVSRCVRLNNYWCIKRAGWAGEIAADADDHVAFASAIEGADVAALLLRRYYIDLKRHSALDIVSRWAPAALWACRAEARLGGTSPPGRTGSRRGASATPCAPASLPGAQGTGATRGACAARWCRTGGSLWPARRPSRWGWASARSPWPRSSACRRQASPPSARGRWSCAAATWRASAPMPRGPPRGWRRRSTTTSGCSAPMGRRPPTSRV